MDAAGRRHRRHDQQEPDKKVSVIPLHDDLRALLKRRTAGVKSRSEPGAQISSML